MKALDVGDQRAALALAAYKKLFEIEAEIRDLGPEAKLIERRARSKPVWDALAAWCAVRKKHEPPASKLGAALRYFTNHEPRSRASSSMAKCRLTTASSSECMSARL